MHTTKAALLKAMITRPQILVMPGAYDPMSAKLIQSAGFEAIQCTGFGIVSTFLGLPDASIISMSDMAARTASIARAVDIPVMADGDTGFGNAVNVWYTVREFEAVGAAGINIEDQILPKRCGHLDGKLLIEIAEMKTKIAAARDARHDPDFVINARTDALAVEGVSGAIERGNAYLAAGATMIFIDGVDSRESIRELVAGIRGPVAVNLVEGGKSPRGLKFKELEAMGVARVSVPGSPILAALRAIENILAKIKEADGIVDDPNLVMSVREAQDLAGMSQVRALEQQYLSEAVLSEMYRK